jgi:drug/metabolite transporter (DMT)-like permease
VSTASRPRGEAVGGLLVGSASLLFGAVVIFGKLALRKDLPVTSMLAARYALAAAVLLVALTALRRPLLPARGERLGIAILGTCLYALESSLFFAGLRYGTAAAVTLLFFTYPVFVTVASWALGRGRPSWLTLLSLMLAVAGAGLVVGAGSGLAIEGAGVLFALGAALTYTVYLLGADRVLRTTPALTSATWVSAGASIGIALAALASGAGRMPSDPSAWWPVVGMGFATAAAFVCLMAGLQRIGAVRTSIVAATEPLAAAFLGFVFLGESVALGTVVGGALILSGAVIASLARAVTAQEQQIP